MRTFLPGRVPVDNWDEDEDGDEMRAEQDDEDFSGVERECAGRRLKYFNIDSDCTPSLSGDADTSPDDAIGKGPPVVMPTDIAGSDASPATLRLLHKARSVHGSTTTAARLP